MILRFEHLNKYPHDCRINKNKWIGLSFKLSECLYNKTSATDLSRIENFDRDATGNMIDDHLALWDVYDLFKEKLTKAVERKSEDEKLFINTVKTIWGEYLEYISDEIRIEPKGRKISQKTISDRIDNFKKYLMNNKRKSSGTFYTRDMPTFLCYLAFVIYRLIFSAPIRAIKQLKYEIKRVKAITEMQENIEKYEIRPYELSFSTLMKLSTSEMESQ